MCDYSLERFSSREATVGDKLVVPPYAHGFARARDAGSIPCMTCLKEGTVVNVTIKRPRHGVRSETRRGVVARLNTDYKHEFHDYIHWADGSGGLYIAALNKGTTAEVISIPGQPSLDEKLGLDKLDTKPVEREPILARVLARVMGVLRPVTA